MTDKSDRGIYVLERGNSAFLSILKNKSLHASFDLWHAYLGHVNHSVTFDLNKHSHLYLTFLLPSPTLCSTCHLTNSHCLPYLHNDHRLSHVLDFIHCDIWSPSLVKSNLEFTYYILSQFTWLYLLKFKYDFFDVLTQF